MDDGRGRVMGSRPGRLDIQWRVGDVLSDRDELLALFHPGPHPLEVSDMKDTFL